MTEVEWQLIAAARTLALREVVNSRRHPPREGDPGYPLRKIFRWYAKTFFTPIHEVEELPLYDVLQAYFESTFEDLDHEALDIEVADLVETDEELESRQKKEDVDDYYSYLDVKDIAAEEAVAKALKDAEKVVKPFQKTLAALSKEPQLAPTRKLPPKKEPAPEAISMDFAKFDDEETDTLGFSLFDQPKKKS